LAGCVVVDGAARGFTVSVTVLLGVEPVSVTMTERTCFLAFLDGRIFPRVHCEANSRVE
jgi:hypothetical protein